jgi:hypothetical protein
MKMAVLWIVVLCRLVRVYQLRIIERFARQGGRSALLTERKREVAATL